MRVLFDSLVKQYMMVENLSLTEACSLANYDIKQSILDGLIDGKDIIVLYGAPGACSINIIDCFDEPNNALLIEVIGINMEQNEFLNKMKNIEYLMVYSDIENCIKRVQSRNWWIDSVVGVEEMIAIIYAWHDFYREPVDSIYQLPIDRVLKFE